MSEHPLVSVILPYRNRADVLSRAVVSVLTQTRSDLELIVIDDASTDRSAMVVNKLLDHRVLMLNTAENRGAGAARNIGIDAARGRFLAFIDSDDYWLPSKLEVQLDAYNALLRRSRPIAAVGCQWSQVDARTDQRRPLAAVTRPAPEARCYQATAVLAGCVPGVGTPMILLDRERVDTSVRFDESFSSLEERDYLFRSLSGTQIAVVPEQLAIVQRGRGDHLANATRGLAALERYLEKYKLDFSDLPRVREWYHYMAMREALRSRDLRAARRHLQHAGTRDRYLLWTESVLGAALGERGLALAARTRLRADYSDRCLAGSLELSA